MHHRQPVTVSARLQTNQPFDLGHVHDFRLNLTHLVDVRISIHASGHEKFAVTRKSQINHFARMLNYSSHQFLGRKIDHQRRVVPATDSQESAIGRKVDALVARTVFNRHL